METSGVDGENGEDGDSNAVICIAAPDGTKCDCGNDDEHSQ